MNEQDMKNPNNPPAQIPQWPPIIDRKAELCPVCRGEGHVHRGSHSTTDNTLYCCTCNGCGGRGWVVI